MATNDQERSPDDTDESQDIPRSAHMFAAKEFVDAREQLLDGNYSGAALFVHNGRADIQDYAPVEYGAWQDRFDEIYYEYTNEIAKSGTKPALLNDYPNYSGRYGGPDPDDEYLLERLNELAEIEQRMTKFADEYHDYFDSIQFESDKEKAEETLNKFDFEYVDDVQCIRCGKYDYSGMALLDELPGAKMLCYACIYYLTVIQHESPEKPVDE